MYLLEFGDPIHSGKPPGVVDGGRPRDDAPDTKSETHNMEQGLQVCLA